MLVRLRPGEVNVHFSWLMSVTVQTNRHHYDTASLRYAYNDVKHVWSSCACVYVCVSSQCAYDLL